jgi:hypothetical protein
MVNGGVELGGGAQRAGVGPAQACSARRGQVVGAWRSPVCSPGVAAQSDEWGRPGLR